ncbi:hypothetical protein BDZ45DRAFT_703216 [Acephala macrosclerotiorum]|nr:hypothetical protein BDZ45DRAFT_703216 [Acephala macrosclerotiorum]
MRPLNSKTRKLEEFFDDQLPSYAILSHTWDRTKDSCKKGNDEGFSYIWIDTVCTDKSSSAELSQGINSMYAWYGKAQRCYAFLADVPADVDVRWFTRGWTLQELIAPRDVIIYSQDWVKLGEKSSGDDSSLHDTISRSTGIDVDVVKGRMSWAATRTTTRVEDRAYCLMGLFNVNMPMLYGDGEKAFIRLQEEIVKDSDDQSLFAWKGATNTDSHRGLLARSPADFGSEVFVLGNIQQVLPA